MRTYTTVFDLRDWNRVSFEEYQKSALISKDFSKLRQNFFLKSQGWKGGAEHLMVEDEGEADEGGDKGLEKFSESMGIG